MKSKLIVILVLTLLCLSAMAISAPSSSSLSTLGRSERSLDGTNPPHAVDIDGKTIPESSATQPDKPIILGKDSKDPKWGEHKPEAAFDHTKHHDLTHTMDGKTATACVECHHTEQPSAPSNQPYLKRFERKAVLTAEQLESSKEPVRSCRNCHWQEATTATAEFPPKSVKYPKETGKPPSGKLTNDNAYHTNCLGCHDVAMKRDPKLKAPQACGDCHVKKM
jgi:cytochrome c553